MLNVLLFILKLAGILISIILGLLVIVLLLVLIIPFRYRIKAVKCGDVAEAEVKLGWIIRIVKLHFFKENEKKPVFDIYLLWKKLNTGGRKEKPDIADSDNTDETAEGTDSAVADDIRGKKTKRKKAAAGKSVKVEKEVIIQDKDMTSACDKGKQSEQTEDEVVKQSECMNDKAAEQSEHIEDDTAEQSEYTDDETKKQDTRSEGKGPAAFFGKLRLKIRQTVMNIRKKVQDIYNKIVSVLKNIADTIRNINNKRELVVAFIQSENNRKAFKGIFSQVVKILKHIVPKKFKGEVIFGTGDGCSTGEIFRYIGMFYWLLGDKLYIEADFSGKRLELDIMTKGRIRLGTIVYRLLKILFSKEFKVLRRNIMALKAKLQACEGTAA